jgi:hypothetical protein
MNALFETIALVVNTLIEDASALFAFLQDLIILAETGLSFAFAFVPLSTPHGEIPKEVLAAARRWNGTITDRFNNIDMVTNLIKAHIDDWGSPDGLAALLSNSRNRLQVMIAQSDSSDGSGTSRMERNTLLLTTVALCVHDVKLWAYGQYRAGILSADDVHHLCFLLPGERGGHHKTAESTHILPEVKVKVVNGEKIRVVIDQAVNENSAKVVHGWPDGVKQAEIVIFSAEDRSEVLHKMTSHLYTDIELPKDSRGKQFLAAAAFLRHVSDSPSFGADVAFSIPLRTADLIKVTDQQHFDDYEERLRAIEQHRLELDELEEELNRNRNKK